METTHDLLVQLYREIHIDMDAELEYERYHRHLRKFNRDVDYTMRYLIQDSLNTLEHAVSRKPRIYSNNDEVVNMLVDRQVRFNFICARINPSSF